tara:strand:- start:133 stop:1038 length:906 start_codon:yes stop_codon:yes gene_type:complete
MPMDDNGNVIGLIDERFRGMDTTQVFNILKNEIPEQPPAGGGEKGEEGDDGDGGDGGGKTPQSHDEHDWEGAAELTEEEEAELKEEIEQALREGSQLVGKRGGHMSKGITEALIPKVNWKDALRDEVKQVMRGHDDSTWRRLNKKYLAIDVIMAGAESTRVGYLCGAEDISGSISSYERAQFRGEVKLICDEVTPEKLHLLYWDTDVVRSEVYEEHDMPDYLNSEKPQDGGGTDPDCVPLYMHENGIAPEILIMFTDGYLNVDQSNWSTVKCPVIWCVVNNKGFTAPFGKTIHVNIGGGDG